MHLWRIAALLAVLAVLPFPFAGAASRASRERPSNRCHAVRVEAVDGSTSTRAGRKTAFSASAVGDLRIKVWVSEKQASVPVRVKLYTPSGNLYQVLEATGDGRAAAGRPGKPGQNGSRALSATLSVAGTHITTYALYGEWRAEAYFNGASVSCAPPLEFVIGP